MSVSAALEESNPVTVSPASPILTGVWRSVSSGNDKARVRVFQGFAQEIDVFFRRLESGDNVDDQLRTLSFIGHGQRLLSEFVLIVTRNFNAVRIQRNSFSVNHQRALIQIQIAAENVNRLRC